MFHDFIEVTEKRSGGFHASLFLVFNPGIAGKLGQALPFGSRAFSQNFFDEVRAAILGRRGPHRDEMRYLSNGIDLGNFGSRGQLRTAMLAIKLAEVNWLNEKNGDWPVLLLDEVLAELDDTRRQDLLDRLAKTEQSLLTTTDLNLFSDEFKKSATHWKIKNGGLTN